MPALQLSVELAEWIAQQERNAMAEADRAWGQISHLFETDVADLYAQVAGRVLERSCSEENSYFHRLWACFEFHWRQLGKAKLISFLKALQCIKSGRLYYGRVKANVLYDVALAQASGIQGEAKAAEIFEADYMPIVLALSARHLGGPQALSAVDNFAAELILPRAGSPPRIRTFRGKTPLTNWLRSVVANFWVTQQRSKRLILLAEVPDKASLDGESQMGSEHNCEDLLKPIFAAQGAQTHRFPATCLFFAEMIYLDGVPQKALARSLGVNSGTVTRRRQSATAAILGQLRLLAAARPDRDQVEECLQSVLAGDDPSLRDNLANTLTQGLRKVIRHTEPR